jgi:Ca2+-binding EF-hand superfamily protein
MNCTIILTKGHMMKTLQILAITSLLLGLAQTANADHHEMKHDHAGAHAHSWQDADANKDGVVSKDEFLAKHQESAEKMFSKMDGNKDGKLDETERKAMHEKCDRHAK